MLERHRREERSLLLRQKPHVSINYKCLLKRSLKYHIAFAGVVLLPDSTQFEAMCPAADDYTSVTGNRNSSA